MPGKVGRPGGPPRLGTLVNWQLHSLFGGWVVVGWLGGDRFASAVRCFDGDGSGVSMLWTDDGRVRIAPDDRAKALVG
jgi:hypothetical protein